ncbi:MAG: LysM peptidoglycan-binding domain-containing protein [Candidatus Riflebacteria bacterium]|nr:LysM peptidoglycan-binding domain-containing protein [Candidatus Riflebacteria bacterium]
MLIKSNYLKYFIYSLLVGTFILLSSFLENGNVLLAANPFDEEGSVKMNFDNPVTTDNNSASDFPEPDPSVTPAVKTSTAQTTSTTSAVKFKTHKVKSGETLRDLAQKYFGDPNKYTLIIKYNKEKYPSLAKNPDMISPGWELKIPEAQSGSGNSGGGSSSNGAGTGSNTVSSDNKSTGTSKSNSTSTSTSTGTGISTSRNYVDIANEYIKKFPNDVFGAWNAAYKDREKGPDGKPNWADPNLRDAEHYLFSRSWVGEQNDPVSRTVVAASLAVATTIYTPAKMAGPRVAEVMSNAAELPVVREAIGYLNKFQAFRGIVESEFVTKIVEWTAASGSEPSLKEMQAGYAGILEGLKQSWK